MVAPIFNYNNYPLNLSFANSCMLINKLLEIHI